MEIVKSVILDYSIGESKNNNLYVKVLFQAVETNKVYTWFGSLNEGTARNITMSALMKMGLNTPNLLVLNKGVTTGALDVKKTYELKIEMKPDQYGVLKERVTNIKVEGEPDGSRLETNALKEKLMGTTIADELAMKISKRTGTDNEEVPF